LLLLSVLCILGTVFSSPAFEGEWYLQVTGKHEEENEVLLNLTSSSGSSLSGVLKSCCGGNWRVTIDFSSSTSGEVLLSALTDTESEQAESGSNENSDGFGDENDAVRGNSILEFDLKNRTNGLAVSSGPFLGEGKGAYHLTVTSPLTFVFTVVDKEGQSFTITGRKEVRVVDGGFWSRFPSPMMMVGIMLLSQWLKPRMPEPREAAQGQADGRAARNNGEARVTDVTEEQEGVQ